MCEDPSLDCLVMESDAPPFAWAASAEPVAPVAPAAALAPVATAAPITYPNLAGKHAKAAVISPSDFVAYLRRIGQLPAFDMPRAVLLCYQRSLYEHIAMHEAHVGPPAVRTHRGLLTLPRTGHRVGVVGKFGIGAPAAAGLLEELIALGATHVIAIGTAGSLQPGRAIGQPIVCERAIRDEGVSHHYLPPAKYVEASAGLTAGLRRELDARGVLYEAGASWTVDALFRETVDEVQHYQAEGVLCVDMEAAALFSIGTYRSVDVASLFVVGDSLADAAWQPAWHSHDVSAGLAALADAAIAVLERACA